MIVSAHFSAVEIHFFQLVSSASSRSFTHTYALKSHTTLWTPNVIQQFSLKHRFIFVLKMRMTILQTQNWHFFSSSWTDEVTYVHISSFIGWVKTSETLLKNDCDLHMIIVCSPQRRQIKLNVMNEVWILIAFNV